MLLTRAFPLLAACAATTLSITAAHADELPPLNAPAASPGTSAVVVSPAPAPDGSPVADPVASSSVKMTYESTRVDRPAQSEPRKASPDDSTLLHGFRIGYGHVTSYDKPVPSLGGKSLKEQVGLRAPHHLLLGYEVMYRVASHSWLNVLLLANAMVAGIEQSKFLPSGNLLIGAEIKNSFQVGIGANLSPLKGSEAHAIVAAGWTPRVGSIYTPVHFYFIPDVDGVHRMGVTTGVTF